jgi:hypothetical protein
VLLFAILAIQVKRRCPVMRTYLEVILRKSRPPLSQQCVCSSAAAAATCGSALNYACNCASQCAGVAVHTRFSCASLSSATALSLQCSCSVEPPRSSSLLASVPTGHASSFRSEFSFTHTQEG